MAERELVVRLIGDSRSLERAFLRSSRSGRQFSVQMSGISRSLARGLGFAAATAGIASFGLALRSTINAAIDFESSFAGVRKTVDATEPQFAELAKGFRELAKEIPVSVNELNKIGEAAGQLGIQREAILGFTRTVADLGVTTNLSSDEAATSLARLANITQLPQDQFDQLGSAVVELGNKLATTEAEIVGFGLRIAGAGRQVNLTEAQILAIGGAFSSVGVEAERGGTAISKTLLLIQSAVLSGGKSLEAFAKVAGQSAEEFRRSFQADAGAAFTSFIEGLERIRQSGGDAGKALRDLGLSDQRLVAAFLAMGGAGDLLRRSLQLGTDAFRENTALTEEAAKRYETTASKLQIFRQQVNDLQITLGEVLAPALLDIIEPLGEWLAQTENQALVQEKLTNFVKDATSVVKAFAAVIGPLASAIKTTADATVGLERAIRILITAMVIGKVLSFSTALTGIGTQALLATGRTNALRVALTRLGAIGVIAITIDMIINPPKWSDGRTFDSPLGFGEGIVPGLDRLLGRSDDAATRNRFQDQANRNVISDAHQRQLVREAADAHERMRAIATDIADDAEKTATKAEPESKRRRKSLETILKGLGLKLDRALLTKDTADDIAALREMERAIQRRIRAEGRTFELVRQLVDVRRQIQVIEEAARASSAAARKSVAKIGESLSLDLGDQRKRDQFKALGLTAEGQERVAGIGALRRRGRNLIEQLKVSGLDPSKIRAAIRRISVVFTKEFNDAGRDVRQAIIGMFDDIASAFNQGTTRRGPLTATSGLNTKKMLQGLGLSEEQINELRGRLSKLTSAGQTLGPRVKRDAALAGFGGVQGAILVESHVTVMLDGEKVGKAVTRSQQKTRRRNPQQKRGPNRNR